MRPKSFKLLSFFWEFNRWLVLLSILSGVIAGITSAALVTLINGRITGSVPASPTAVRAYIICAVLALIAITASGFLSSQLAQRSSAHLRLYLCRRILAVPLRSLEEAGAHRILTALTQDISVLIGAFLRVPPFFINLAVVTGGLVYLGWLSPVMLLMLIGFVVVAIVSYVFPQRTANRYMARARGEYATMVSHFRALTSGSKELKLHRSRRAAFFSEIVEPTIYTLRRNTITAEGIYVLLNSWSQILYFIVIGLILYAMPGIVGDLSLQILTGYALTVLYISGPIQSLVGIVPNFSQAAISLQKLEELGLSLNASDTSDDDDGASPEPEPNWERIEIDGVTHTYFRESEASKFVLGPISLNLKPGELVFLVGGNGSGKTTFAKLLCGLYTPEEGQIRLDGVPVTTENVDDYRQYFSVIFTEFHVFEQLLGLRNPDLDDAARQYLIQLQLDKKVEVKDGKLSTTELSYGQRKRLALLTAFLEDRPLYIFDEWAADQDPLFRDFFYHHILTELKSRGKTVIVISHDDHYYHLGDRIVRLEYGQLEYDKCLKQPTEGATPLAVAEQAHAHALSETATTPQRVPVGIRTPSGSVAPGVLDDPPRNGSKLREQPSVQFGQISRNGTGDKSKRKRPEEFEKIIEKNHAVIFLLILMFVSALAWLAIHQVRPPDKVSASAPADQFSSARAMNHLRVIADQPHPSGASAHGRVRDYILKTLRDEGLDPEIQNSVAVKQGRGSSVVASVQNVAAILKGTEPNQKALLLAAHYDSAPNSPGASDDGAGVAALLETLRALKAGTPLKRDVVFLFTDAEEPGLLGSKAFVEEHEWAKKTGLALNFEARGSRGAVFMFETSEANSWLVEQFGAAAPKPFASSLMYTIYKLLPNDTDLTNFRRAGIGGMNFAYIDAAQHYHTPQDNLQNIDERSLQHQGSYALALARHFGNLNLENIRQGAGNQPPGDSVYFDLLGLTFISYRQAWVLPLSVLLVCLFVAAFVFGLRRQVLTARGSILGVLALVLSMVCSAGIVKLIWWGLTSLHSGYTPRTHAHIFIFSFTALTLGITVAIYTLFVKRAALINLAAGALLCWTLAMLATGIYLPGASYLFMWPLLSSLAAFAFFVLSDGKTWPRFIRLVVLCVTAIPGVLFLTGVIYNLYQGVGLGMPEVLVVLEVMLLGLLIPLLRYIAPAYRWLFVTLCVMAGAISVFIGAITPIYNDVRPRPDSIMYSLNADTGETTWVSSDRRPDEWTSQFFKGDADSQPGSNTAVAPAGGRPLTAAAPAVELAKEELSVIEDQIIAGVRRVRVRITSPRRARLINMYVDPSVKIAAAVVNGKRLDYADPSVSGQPAAGWELAYLAAPAEGIDLTLETASPAPLKLKIAGYSDGLPQIPSMNITPRPPHLMAAPHSDLTRIVRVFDLGAQPSSTPPAR